MAVAIGRDARTTLPATPSGWSRSSGRGTSGFVQGHPGWREAACGRIIRAVDETPQDELDVGRELRSRVAVENDSELRAEWPPPKRRALRRRADGKWLGGVAGGLADHWRVPALFVRVPLALAAFVTASVSWTVFTSGDSIDAPDGIFFPVVIGSFVATVAYFVLWVVVPREDVARSPVGRVGARLSPRRLTERYPNIRSVPAFAALAIGGAILAERLGIWEPDLALAAALIALGIWLYRRDRDVRSDVSVVETADETGASATGAIAPPAAHPYTPVPRAPRERSPLGWITFGVALLVVCIAAIWARLAGDSDVTGAVLEAERATGLGRIVVIPALGLLVLALGLLLGSMFGRARWLILPAFALVPVVLLTSVVRLPFEGEIGDTFLRVGAEAGDASDEIVVRRRAFGSIHVDLNRLRGSSDVTRELRLSTVAGTVTVVVPFDAHVQIRAFIGLGTIGLERRHEYGVELSQTAALEPRHGDGATVIVSAEVGVGNVHVLRYAPTKRQLRHLEQQERRDRGNQNDGGGS